MAWDAIVGQDTVVRVLRTHLNAGCVPNAYLLAGPEGIGKRKIALEFAKAINCKTGQGASCGACATCGQIERQAHPDVHWLLPSGASDQIKIDDIRHLLGRVGLRPFSAAYQVAIIDGAERLTEEAANSLLKSLEEPSSRTRYVLTTAQLPRCLATVVSRCQLLRCQPLSPEIITRLLIETQACEPAMARAVAPKSQGSIARATAAIERWTQRQAVIDRLANAPGTGWGFQAMPESRQDVAELLDTMVWWLRDLACLAVAEEPADAAERLSALPILHADRGEILSAQAAGLDVDRCLDTAFELIRLRESLEQFVSPRLVASLARETWLSLQDVTAGK